MKATDTEAFSGVPTTAVGAPGTPVGIIEFDGADAALEPATLIATAVNVYDVPLVRPVTTMGEADPCALIEPGFEVTV